jgi:hypothetical protein
MLMLMLQAKKEKKHTKTFRGCAPETPVGMAGANAAHALFRRRRKLPVCAYIRLRILLAFIVSKV